jgi:hypothetical protein
VKVEDESVKLFVRVRERLESGNKVEVVDVAGDESESGKVVEAGKEGSGSQGEDGC